MRRDTTRPVNAPALFPFLTGNQPDKKQKLLFKGNGMNHIDCAALRCRAPHRSEMTVFDMGGDIPITQVFGTVMMSEVAVALAVIVARFFFLT